MEHALFSGVCTAMVTPFIGDQINYPMVDRLLERQIGAGIPAVVLAGTTGESPTLTDEEKLSLFYRGKSYAEDRCLIIAGTGSNSTEHTVALSKEAEKIGVDALLVVAPYYNKGNPEGLYLHFATIARSVKIPVIIYNVPSRTGVDIPVSVYRKLSAIPNIAGVKEAGTDITKIAKIRKECGKNFVIWSGNDDQIVPTISMGGFGVISVLSNIFPEETAAMANAALLGDFATASALQVQLSQMIDLLFAEVNPIPVKYAMKHVGFDCGPCRLPLGPLSGTTQDKIDTYFKA